MTREAKVMSGIILMTAATIQYGGYFRFGRISFAQDMPTQA